MLKIRQCERCCLLGVPHHPVCGSLDVVQAAELAVRAGVEAGGGAALPGMILNTSKTTTYTDAHTGQEHSVPAGRMECTMQVAYRTHAPVVH